MKEENRWLYKKIADNGNLNMWEEHNFIDSEFVEIPNKVEVNNKIKIIVDMQYPQLGMKNAIKECLIRKEALEKLLIACRYLPQELTFKIWDAYRPWSLQNELYYAYKPDIIKQFKLENLSLEEQDKTISKYVSIPNKNEELPPLHTTGGSIDLTLTNLETNQDLDFGVKFDEFSDLTNTASFEEKNLNETIKNNRRLLYNIMTKSGFTNLSSEIWHYDYGNRAWGYYKKKPAIYKGVLEYNKITSIISFEEFIERGSEKNKN